MSQPAITVENLGKAYRIGLKEEIPNTFTAAATQWIKSPLRNFHRLRRLNTFGSNGHDEEDVVWALKDVSFDVQEGEVVGIIGRNGAGKSTLLKILSRITEPTTGEARIRGRVSSLLEVGTGFHPELSGRENVYMNATILGMTKREIDRRFDEIVEFSGVEKFLDTPVKRYSSGMKVRLAFAVAAHLDPEILIIDEVLAVGDAEFQNKCLGKMQDVAGSGRTVLFVSHNMAAVESLCKRGIEIAEGRVVFCGSVDEAISHYRRGAFQGSNLSLDGKFEQAECILSASLVDSADLPVDFVILGGTFHLRILLDTTGFVRAPVVGVGIDNVHGQRMLTAHSDSTIPIQACPQYVYCNIPAFPLGPGRYVLKIAVSEGTSPKESLENIVPFSVADTLLPGQPRGHHRGLCIARSNWVAGELAHV